MPVFRPKENLTPRQREANRLLGGDATHCLLYGGARSGKSFIAVRALLIRALKAPGSRHGIFRLRFNHVRASIWLDTLPKVWAAITPERLTMKEQRQDGYVRLENKSEIWFGGLDEKERTEKVLGQEYATLLFEECSQIPYASVSIARTRLAQRTPLRLKAYYTENPPGTGHWSYQEFIDKRDPTARGGLVAPDDFGSLSMNPIDNLQHLPEGYLKSLEALPERQRRRFLHGRFSEEAEGALWTEEVLDRCRCTARDLPAVSRTVVAVDPSGAKGREDLRSDEIGIVVAARGEDGRGYVLHDGSLRGSPEEWARVAVGLYDRYFADVIVAERNFGGDLVRAVIQGVRPGVNVKLLTASKGKAVRAEPVAALYEERQDKVRHVGTFPELEDQLTSFTSAGYTGSRSPDRADAMIWSLTELMLDSEPLFYVG